MAVGRRLATALSGAAVALVLAAAPFFGNGASGLSTQALAASAAAGDAGSGKAAGNGNAGNSSSGKGADKGNAGNGNSGKGAGNGNAGNGSSGKSAGKGTAGSGTSGKGAGNGNADRSSSGNGTSDNGNAVKGNSGSANAGAGRDPDGESLAPASGADGFAARFGSDFGTRPNEHVNPVTGTMIEINGSNVEVLHLDGFREEILDGRYSMNDAQGRLIVERNATESDRARFRAMLRF